MSYRTRFAPSPTGPLHLGHAYSALVAARRAEAAGGTFLLRIEDIDQSRARPEWEAQIDEDLSWLGLDWPRPEMRQSQRLPAYRAALQTLWDMGLLYPCSCTRRDIAEAASAPQEGAPQLGPDGIVYPGTCRPETAPEGPLPDAVLRLDMARALERACRHQPLFFTETGKGPNGESGARPIARRRMIEKVGDVVLARQGMGTSYHLSVVVDDAEQQITEVVRGQDLFEATPIHVLLQRLLGLPVPLYHHHRLIRDEAGKRLAKRDDARAIRLYRDEGKSPADILKMIGLARSA
ncbi:glutamyl-Q tRNA(Asp) synthetase [Pseudooceanicola antarcticus]|uniref:Glutamyl-Q tRNA(Asp) synthetase n=1 Tax=Pseudooceanicola antarcticus TaxID=1247613 RepID=A0A285IW49_9RHOB|nr:tRNA glutamyl-Q(34) synthetase GluQRS [Pseudooceanicola antarcticus]PJE25956.1 tRNA glutamyl-Q(34) synthetase GluQRS [Pseudooceanicola antarcticus]SNY52265.1 glutamyl-Q tRNA(Asp) synthetase [Pseudooceanicola antarcticus]